MAEEDTQRLEDFTLSQECEVNMRTDLDQSHLQTLLSKSERMLEIRKLLNMKLIHQLEAVEIIFQLAMLTENLVKVRV